MDYFPAFIKVEGKKILIVGGTESALHKVRLLRKTSATLIIQGAVTDATLARWITDGSLEHSAYPIAELDLSDTAFAYIATPDPIKRDEAIERFETTHLPYSVVDDKERSSFITPALVDRDPVVIAIGTEGTAPVMARAIKAKLESDVSSLTGLVAKVAGQFRERVGHLPQGIVRRRFWQHYLNEIAPKVIATEPPDPESHLRAGLEHLLAGQTNGGSRVPLIRIINIESGQADLLTRQAARWLDDADIVFHQAATPREILELTRRESNKIEYAKQMSGGQIASMLEAATSGQIVAVLTTSSILPFREEQAHTAGVRIDHAAYIERPMDTFSHLAERKVPSWFKTAS